MYNMQGAVYDCALNSVSLTMFLEYYETLLLTVELESSGPAS